MAVLRRVHIHKYRTTRLGHDKHALARISLDWATSSVHERTHDIHRAPPITPKNTGPQTDGSNFLKFELLTSRSTAASTTQLRSLPTYTVCWSSTEYSTTSVIVYQVVTELPGWRHQLPCFVLSSTFLQQKTLAQRCSDILPPDTLPPLTFSHLPPPPVSILSDTACNRISGV